MSNTLRAAQGGNTEATTSSGPSSYPTGGFSLTSDLGRVDEVIVDAQAGAYKAIRESVSENSVTVGVYSQASGNEVAAGTDLSSTDFTHVAFRL